MQSRCITPQFATLFLKFAIQIFNFQRVPSIMLRVTSPNHVNLMIIAGEPSGDAHASSLVKALKATVEDKAQLKFFGATGPLMRAAGVESVVQSDELSILGLLEIARALPGF